MASLPPGVSGNPKALLNKNHIAFLVALRRALPASIPLYVNSGTRTPEQQAAALKTKRDMGDNLYKLYRADYIVKELMAAPNTVAGMAPIIRKWANKGVYMSRHMRGDALDFSIWRGGKLTKRQIDTVMAAAKRLGAKAIYESKPPHIHVEAIGGTLSDVRLAAGEKARKAERMLTQGTTQAQRRAKRSTRRALRLYKQRKILYTVGAVTGVTVLLFGIFAASRYARKGRQ
jgi:hypothetical protein